MEKTERSFSDYTNARFALFVWCGKRLYLLLVCSSEEKYKGWFPPGGKRDPGELSARDTIIREFIEELIISGFDIQDPDLLILLAHEGIIQKDQFNRAGGQVEDGYFYDKQTALYYAVISRSVLPKVELTEAEKEKGQLTDVRFHDVLNLPKLEFNYRHTVFQDILVELSAQIYSEGAPK